MENTNASDLSKAETETTQAIQYNDIIQDTNKNASIMPAWVRMNSPIMWGVIAVIIVTIILLIMYFTVWSKSTEPVTNKSDEGYRARQPRDDAQSDFDLANTVAEITERQEEVLQRIKNGD